MTILFLERDANTEGFIHIICCEFELSFKKLKIYPQKYHIKDIQDFYDRLIVLFNLFACIIVYLFNVVFLFVFLFPFLYNYFFFEGMFLFVFCFVFVCLFVRVFFFLFFFLFVCFFCCSFFLG